MKKILVVQNVTRERLGLLQDLLVRNHISWDAADLDAGCPFPDPLAYDALIVFGGPDSANDATPKMCDELEKTRAAVRAGLPYLGICLGMQVLAKACGGDVIQNATKEIGWRDPGGDLFSVNLTPQGPRDPLFAGLNAPFVIFQLHGETIAPPPGAALLATGAFCEHQVVRIGELAYGIQGHFELTEPMFEDWLAQDDDLQTLDPAPLRRDFAALKSEYTRTGNTLFSNFLALAGLTR